MRLPVELGCKGHFTGAKDCQWSRHTQVGLLRVSTVGEYWPDRDATMQPMGSEDQFYETMVFLTTDVDTPGGCGCKEVKLWHELVCERYPTAREAARGHDDMVNKLMMNGEMYHEFVNRGDEIYDEVNSWEDA
jgi:hypothetical protein